MAATNTSFTFLYHKKSPATDFTKLVDITDYPDIFQAPEKVDVSTLTLNQKVYIKGMVDLPDLEFGTLYNKADYTKIKALETDDTVTYQLRFGEDGEYGAWEWTGGVFFTPIGGAVGDVRKGKITCYPSTEIRDATITP